MPAIVPTVRPARMIRRLPPINVLCPCWSPNRLRHSMATEVRRNYGLEAVQVVLGHATANVTQIYAERDLNLAARIMRGWMARQSHLILRQYCKRLE